MTKSDQVIVYTTDKDYDASFVIRYLSEHGIEAFSLDQKDSSYHFGEIKITVSKNDEKKSRTLIEEYRKK